MKALLTMVLLLTSLSSFAAESPDYLLQFWNSRYEIVDTLFDNYGRGEGRIPNTGVTTQFQTHYVKLHKVCIEGDMVRTINPIKTCAQRGYKVVNCGHDDRPDANGKCYDRDTKVCVDYRLQYGYSKINGTKETCARYWDKESREWRRKNDRDDFEDDYPNCSVYKTYSTKKRIKFNFDIVKNVSKNSPKYSNRYKGQLVENVDVTLPACAK